MLMRVNKCCHVLPFHGHPYLKVTFCTTILGSLSPDSLLFLIFEHNHCTKAKSFDILIVIPTKNTRTNCFEAKPWADAVLRAKK